MITRVKGTQDILDVTLRNIVVHKIRCHLQKYNFTEIITPILEKTELFQRVVGNETDIVTKEMYYVASKSESDEHLCLRPELTASIMRAFLNNGIQLVPWKVFTYGPAFRHERPQKGRYREFYTMSIEVIGASAPAGDAYFVAMLDRLFGRDLQLENYSLLLNFLGCPADRERYRQALHAFLVAQDRTICETCHTRKAQNVLRALDCKRPECQALYQSAPVITDYLCQACLDEWACIQALLAQLSVAYTLAPRLVRGLDYYSKIVFEFVSAEGLGAQSTFCGGGRYDTIARQLGADQDYPSIGAGLGIERILLMLQARENYPTPTQLPLHLVLPLGDEQQAAALQLADSLYAHCLRVDVLLEPGSLKSMLRKANARQARTCLLIGTNEQQNQSVTIKDMQKATETSVPQAEAAAFLLKLSQD